MFRIKIRKIGLPLHTPVCYINVGYKGYTLHGHAKVIKISIKAISDDRSISVKIVSTLAKNNNVLFGFKHGNLNRTLLTSK